MTFWIDHDHFYCHHKPDDKNFYLAIRFNLKRIAKSTVTRVRAVNYITNHADQLPSTEYIDEHVLGPPY